MVQIPSEFVLIQLAGIPTTLYPKREYSDEDLIHGRKCSDEDLIHGRKYSDEDLIRLAYGQPPSPEGKAL